MKIIIAIYSLILLLLTVFSYGFVDGNFPWQIWPSLYNLVHLQRGITTLLYSIVVILLFGVYGSILWMVTRKKLTSIQVWKLIFLTVAILLFSFPAFSYDIFNYIATAKVIFFYKENPYIVMPIEIPNEPMLKFTHAANKIALYGPSWILLTIVPHITGLGNIFLTIFTFKAFVILFYLGLSWLIWNLSEKNIWSLAFFALNPLVVVETLISAHNDVVMMFFALLAFYFLKKKKLQLSVICFLLSVLVKFATIFLLPVYIYLFYLCFRQKKIDWQKIWKWSVVSLFTIFLFSPLREELYPWYLIWPLTFVSLLKTGGFLSVLTIGFSFGLELRIAPFLYTREWGGQTPFIKKILVVVPVFLSLIFLFLKKFKNEKFLEK